MITWLEIKQVETAPSTFVNYRRKVDKHILPYWGNQYLDEIPKSEIEYWMKVKLAHLSLCPWHNWVNQKKGEAFLP